MADDAKPTEVAPPATMTAQGPTWPTLTPDHPLTKLIEKLPSAVGEAGHSEVYGVDLVTATPFQRNLILQKFLRANANDVAKAQAQLTSTLAWRKGFEPLKAKDEVFSKVCFGGLGYVSVVEGVPGSGNARDVVTYNVYGAVTDNQATFGDLESFMRWRVGLMELSLAALKLHEATQPIPDFGEGPDPHQGIQVHDYLDVSFLRQDPHSKAAASRAIETFKDYYPETLSRKFFVNVPVVMGWFFNAMKLVLSRETVKKFTVLSYGKYLAGELGPGVPKVYGGQGGELVDTAETLKVDG